MTTEETGRYAIAVSNRYVSRGRTYGTTKTKRFQTPEQRARYADKVMASAREAERIAPWQHGGKWRASRPRVILAWEGEATDRMPCARWTLARGMHPGLLHVNAAGRVHGSEATTD